MGPIDTGWSSGTEKSLRWGFGKRRRIRIVLPSMGSTFGLFLFIERGTKKTRSENVHGTLGRRPPGASRSPEPGHGGPNCVLPQRSGEFSGCHRPWPPVQLYLAFDGGEP